VSVVHVSNTLGTLNPVEKIISAAHKKNIPVLIDGAQAIPHMKVDVKKLGADFYCFSGHKVYGPTGIGVLYIDGKMIEKIPNYQVGGGTIKTVSFEKTDYAESPLRFEAGTPNISGAIGLAEAISYINDIGWDTLEEMESGLMTYALHRLDRIEGLEIFGSPKNRAGVISFNLKNAHPYDVGMILDKQGIAVRTGHHCTQPLLSKFGLSGTVRVSLSFYNTPGEIDLLISGLEKAKKMLE
jgi:cysteine desulfurase / selenocysteine lyase